MAVKKARKSQHFVDIPKDFIFFEILPRCSVKSLIRFKIVCKEWYSFLSCKLLANIQLQLSSERSVLVLHDDDKLESIKWEGKGNLFDFLQKEFDEFDSVFKLGNDVDIVGSCHGMICMYISLDDGELDEYFVLYNPCITDYIKISKHPINEENAFIYGFGYASLMDDYRIVTVEFGDTEIVGYVYSVQSKRWRRLLTDCLVLDCDNPFSFSNNVGELLDETLYWPMIVGKEGCFRMTILAFDLAKERFKTVALPKPNLGDDKGFHHWGFGLSSLNSSLYAWGNYNDGRIEIWGFKRHGGVESWNKVWHLHMVENLGVYDCRDLFVINESGKILILTGADALVFADMSLDPPEYAYLEGVKITSAVKYVYSLISPFLIDGSKNLMQASLKSGTIREAERHVSCCELRDREGDFKRKNELAKSVGEEICN